MYRAIIQIGLGLTFYGPSLSHNGPIGLVHKNFSPVENLLGYTNIWLLLLGLGKFYQSIDWWWMRRLDPFGNILNIYVQRLSSMKCLGFNPLLILNWIDRQIFWLMNWFAWYLGMFVCYFLFLFWRKGRFVFLWSFMSVFMCLIVIANLNYLINLLYLGLSLINCQIPNH